MRIIFFSLFLLFPKISVADSEFYVGKWEAFKPVHTTFFSYLYLEIDESNHGKIVHSLTLSGPEPNFIHEIKPEDIALKDNVVTIGPLLLPEGVEYVLKFKNRGANNGILNITLPGETRARYEYDLIPVGIYRLEKKVNYLQELRREVGVDG